MTSQYGAYVFHAGLARLHALMRVHTPTRQGTHMHARTGAHALRYTYIVLLHLPSSPYLQKDQGSNPETSLRVFFFLFCSVPSDSQKSTSRFQTFHDHFLPHSFRFILHIMNYAVSVADRSAKETISKINVMKITMLQIRVWKIFNSRHGVTSQKPWIFINSAVRTSDLAKDGLIPTFRDYLSFPFSRVNLSSEKLVSNHCTLHNNAEDRRT